MAKAKTDHRKMLDWLSNLLRYFGIWSIVDEPSWFKRTIYIIYTVIMISLIPIFGATIVGDLCDNSDNLLIITDNGLFLAGVTLCLLKLFFFHKHRKQIVNLIDSVFTPLDILMTSSESSVLLLLKYCSFWEQLQEYGFATSAGFLLFALVFLVPTENGSLPIRAKFPFDYTVQPMHTVAFLMQSIGVMNAIVTIFSVDGVILSICRWTSLQIEILNSNFKHCQKQWPCAHFNPTTRNVEFNLMNESDTTINCFIPFSSDEMENNKNFVKRFKICIRHHSRIIDIVGKINELFGAGMFFQLFGSSFIICLTGFQALLGTTGTDSLKYIFFGGVAFFHLGIWCLYGNDLLFQSISLTESQWFSGWEDELSSEVACLLIISFARSGKALELKAGNFYQMSMDTFIMILRTTYSVFALLTAMTDENQPYFGLWSAMYNSSWFREILHIIYTIIMISFMPIFVATIVGDLCENTDNLLMMTDNVLFLTSMSLCLLKLFFFHLYRKQIVNLIDDVYAPVDVLMISSERSVVSLLKYNAFWARAQDYVSGGAAAFLLIALMFLVPTEEGNLPIQAKFPFDYTVQPMHTVAFALQAFGVMNAIVTLFSLDTIVLHICRWTSVQLEILNSNFQHCQPHWPCSRFESIFKDVRLNLMNDGDSEVNCFVPFSIDDVEDNEAFVKRFKICIRHHNRIIDIVEKINDLFGAGMLIQLGCYLLIICLSGFQGLFGTTGTDSLRYMFFAGVGIFNLGVWCFYGNNLLFQSINLMDSQWFSGWEEELTPEVTCLLTVSLARSGRNLHLKAGNYYQMSMDTFIMILKMTYSAFALLATMMEEADS